MTKPICKLNMVLMFKSLIFLFALTGCATRNKTTNTINQDNCLQRYQIALLECQSFLLHEKNLLRKDNQMMKCLQNKQFDQGSQTCS